MCPEPALWWSHTCGPQGSGLSVDALAQVAAMVDERSAVWSYGSTASGFCQILRRARDLNDFARAQRHYAAVLANLAAGELRLTGRDGHGIGLDPAMPVAAVHGMPAGWTVGEWVAWAEGRMLAGQGRGSHAEWHRIARQARAINRLPGTCAASLLALRVDDDDDLGTEGSSMVTATPTDMNSANGSTPAPFGSRGVRWSQDRADNVELAVVDITGRRLRHLASGAFSAGTHELTWDGLDDSGGAAPSGAYFISGQVGSQRLSLKLMIVR
jgi:hypothetical protein